jgi:hypothetical protein
MVLRRITMTGLRAAESLGSGSRRDGRGTDTEYPPDTHAVHYTGLAGLEQDMDMSGSLFFILFH